MATEQKRMRQLQATEAEWQTTDPTLLDGEIALSSDVLRFKAGPGQWSSLAYWGDPAAPSDGNFYGLKDGGFVKGIEYQSTYTGDLNAITLDGTDGVKYFRLVPTITNAWPGGGIDGDFLMHLEWDNADEAIQIGLAYSTADATTHAMFQRVRRGGVWGGWYSNVGFSPNPFSGDLDTVSTAGSYALQFPIANGVINGWTTAAFGDVVQHTNIDATTAIQIGFGVANGTPESWIRTKEADVWSAWENLVASQTVTEADIVDLNRIRWRGNWVANQYDKNDQVLIPGYLAIANADTSEDPNPASSGDPVYQLPSVPAWAPQSFTGVVESGQVYSIPAGSFFSITQYRFWVPTGADVPDYKFALYLSDITDPANTTTSLIASFDGSQLSAGWNSYDNTGGPLLAGGTEFGVYLQTINSSSNSQWSANWDREASHNTNAPSVGFFRTNTGLNQIRFNSIDVDANNQDSNLGLVTVGSEISVFDLADGGVNIFQNFLVTGITDNTTWFEFDAVVVATGPGGAPGVGTGIGANFTIPVTGSTDYVTIANNYSTNPNIIGVLDEGDTGGVTNENAYGVDLQFEELIMPVDWDLIPTSSTVTGGGDSGGGGGAMVYISDIAPGTPVVGDLWYKTSSPVAFYIYTDDGDSLQWVQTNGDNAAGDYALADGTVPFTGNVTLPEAIANTHAATWGQIKAYVDAATGG